ncbi:LPS O-antigen chain length determinant protein WzzB [Pseudomonas sp. PDM05]|uniref:GNVR domain-containing protein n=1 Tax=unclassified Pseudomonas TaxID=196821 RepID=UPI00177C7DAB|nr:MULTISPECIES: GNVR domain-containing protein [unclassified Pseudomonas]MBD9458505.1 LPS O-antigen chain length determinant protein WzzB [Pseudomonas sp. PDM05]WLH80901.1 GNVR domain-containing protein [Pseudomonas sp. FP2335]
MSSSFRTPQISPAEDIQFAAFFRSIWRQKKLILLVSALSTAIAVLYAFVATPEFQVTSVLRPSAINELDALNRSEIYKLPPSEALNKVGAALESYDIRLGFFRANPNLFKNFVQPGRTLEQSFEEFNRNSIKLILPDTKKADSLSAYIKLEMTYPKDIDGVAILNGLIDYAISNEREQIGSDLEVIVKNRMAELNGKLDAARANYETEKQAKIALLVESDLVKRAQLQDELSALRVQLKTNRMERVAQLNEAIVIAKSLGIRKPATPSSFGDAIHDSSTNIMRTEINNQQIPLYFMGVEALEAERTALLQRKSDDFSEKRVSLIAKELQLLQSNRQIDVLNQRKNEELFLSGVAPMRAEAVRLQNLNIDMSRIKLVTIDKQAIEPLSPIKPKKALIIVLGLMLGLIFGVVFAALREFLFLRKRQSS